MTDAGGSLPRDWFALPRRSRVEQQYTPARPPNVRGGRLSIVLSFGAIAIGITALTGYSVASAPIAALGTNGKPVAAVAALALIVLGAGLLALRSPTRAGLLTARRAALGVIVLAVADLLSAAFWQHIEEWKVWAARGGVDVHAYPIATLLLISSASALVFVTMRRDFAGHVIASAVLLICAVFFFANFVKVPSFLDPSRLIAPAAGATFGLALISVAELLARPRGWVVPLLSRTSTGLITRVLLLATFIVPILAEALRDLIAGLSWLGPEVDHAAVVDVVEVFIIAALVLALGLILHKRASDRMRLASIVESSDDAIIGTSNAGLMESWNAGAEHMYGYTAAEAIGRSAAMLAPPERYDESPRLLERIQRGERIEPFETVRVAKDGRRIDVWLSIWPLLDDAGSLVGKSSIAHDITRRKRAEEAMVESEARYRTLVENLPQKIVLKDRNSVYVSVNEALARDLGLEPKAVVGKTDYDFFPEDLAAKYRADDARIMEAGVTEDLEEEYVEGGQRRFIQTVKTPVRDPQGNVTNILVILWDITAKRHAEDQLQKAMVELERSNRELANSEAALREAQRVAQVGHWDWSPATGAVTWSDETYRIMGIPKGSVTPSFELFLGTVVPEDRCRYEDELARALKPGGESDIYIDLGITTPAGPVIATSGRILLDRDAGGNVMTLHGTLQDITQRVATQQALRDSEAALAEAQQIAHIGSWVLDAESGEMQISDEAFRIFAVEPFPDAPMQIFLDRIHEEDRAALEADIAAALQTGTLDVEVRIVTPDGTRVAHIVGRKRGAGEGRPGLIGTTQDITEQKSAEEALRQHSESLERSNLDLERFNRLAIGRELRMIELKQQINDLCAQLGQPAPYVLREERAGAMETP